MEHGSVGNIGGDVAKEDGFLFSINQALCNCLGRLTGLNPFQTGGHGLTLDRGNRLDHGTEPKG